MKKKDRRFLEWLRLKWSIGKRYKYLFLRGEGE